MRHVTLIAAFAALSGALAAQSWFELPQRLTDIGSA